MLRSRIYKQTRSNTKKNIIILLLSAISFFVIIILFGQSIIVLLSLALEKNQNDSQESSGQNINFIPAPELSSSFTATDTAEINVEGYSSKNISVQIYVNDKKEDETSSDSKGKFIFENISLKNGLNEIKTVAKKGKTTSAFSNILSLTLITGYPELTIDFPPDGHTIGKDEDHIILKGKTSENSLVNINSQRPIVHSDGTFEHRITINKGKNSITVSSENIVGKKTEKTISINRQE